MFFNHRCACVNASLSQGVVGQRGREKKRKVHACKRKYYAAHADAPPFLLSVFVVFTLASNKKKTLIEGDDHIKNKRFPFFKRFFFNGSLLKQLVIVLLAFASIKTCSLTTLIGKTATKKKRGERSHFRVFSRV